ncbi:MAG: Murein DD-endopeptidase MepM and murein hydrolase activator NlpD, containing LysM domain [Chloroflexi bacterium AL-W]|nr:Murein DD-endopeptidase MepM and murein hydrolase activator NlpD, containing LysM domain [Chloroflexi bacterium AL-N1]NOK65329.1 Murein DD-endopeptidase MepM and murein hydrolase activator NlpD, containing LysM domain [Chloroflexi bacterium AL-N10]NOK72406.1 Murein DD-endopeptidase MepM and murein hydrolase activator NlpD, containing LysM domain [Chloroflexi bacterium AL-N5]NOK79508.1 Murein DD-endopeptidase MepM and murein hydrolase activator NlpD, containing LysM domain [Chloroflexi bacteri
MARFILLLYLLLFSACGYLERQTTPQITTSEALISTNTPTILATHTQTDLPSEIPTTVSTSISTPKPLTVTPSSTINPTPTATVEPTREATPEAFVYVFPVKNDSCRYPSSHHDYPAADIFCPIGTEFVAVTSGIVDFVSKEDLYAQGSREPTHRGGLSVAIIGDDGIRYYGSHLLQVTEGIEPGTRVQAGQILGLTGDTGNAKGTDPHLHFGISRPTTPEDWQIRRGEVWPQEYLAAWKDGQHMTPVLELDVH